MPIRKLLSAQLSKTLVNRCLFWYHLFFNTIFIFNLLIINTLIIPFFKKIIPIIYANN